MVMRLFKIMYYVIYSKLRGYLIILMSILKNCYNNYIKRKPIKGYLKKTKKLIPVKFKA